MNILSRLGLGAKIGIITLIAIVSFLATLSVNITATNINAKNLKHIESNLYPLSNLSGQNAILIQRIEEQYTQAVSTGEEDLLIKASATLDILRNNLEQVTELDVESSGDSNELTDNLDKYQQLNQKIATAMITGDVDFKVIGEMAKQKSVIYQDLLEKIQNYRTNVDLRFETVMNTAVERSQNTIVLTLTVGGSLLMLMLITAWLVTRSIVQTVNNAATSLNALARGEGDLNYQLPIETEDAFGRMSKNFNCFMQLLKSSISEVLLVADPLSSNASTLENRMHQVSRDMQSQSNTAETLQESMSELQQSVSTTSQSAIAAANAAGDAEREIQRGLSVVDQTTQTSNELNDEISRASEVVHQLATDTQSVNSILDVITTIAEQTNLLALNAAIESARAGAYGRGFAVVADEVRTLASKTSEATTRIRDLVNSLGDAAELSENSMQLATKKSENNLEHARAAGDVLRALQEDIQNINQRNAQIATTTEQQNSMASNASENAAKMYSSLDQMQSGIQEVDSITIELSQFAENLRATTGKFQL